ncbi:hypothetical protein [Mangrovimonas sp. YM274]|uniref:hypothetical protein n=1 Tax=Mangrovimonas sp. YM274 TaxID=3070660 RepID=UPI0027DB9B04|nr:hypothetical protein [Mangrovimonas sp. YM274]WMI67587.1 hypothetical protein RBH95_10570 [Mangrovimonas sp. YM274]
MKTFALTSLLFLATICNINAQEAEEAPVSYLGKTITLDSTITSLYGAISGEKGVERDWKLFKYLFKNEAKLIPAYKDGVKGIYDTNYLSVEDYINTTNDWIIANGYIKKEIHRVTQSYGNITHAFITFEAFRSEQDETPFLRGIDSIELLFDGQRWWVVNLYWTLETEGTPIPEDYLPKP